MIKNYNFKFFAIGWLKTLFVFTAVFVKINGSGQTVLESWSFEGVVTTNTNSSPTFSTGSSGADAGILKAGLAFSAFHSNSTTVWSNPSGNGSLKSVSSTKWSVDDYWQILVSTMGYSSITISWSQTGGATGPRSFTLQYSTTGLAGSFNDFTTVTVPTTSSGNAISWSSGSANAATKFSVDLSSVAVVNNASAIYFRLVDNSINSIDGNTVTTTGTERIDDLTVSAAVILPINLLSFDAIKNNNGNKLTWTTANAVNFSHFELERKTEGRNFSSITTLPISTLNQYTYLDDQPLSTTNYYRLKMVDKDGSFAYSKIVAIVNVGNGFAISSVYPTKTKGDVFVEGFSLTSTNIVSSVYNLSGQKLLEQNYIVNQSFKQHIELGKLPQGIYILKLTNGISQSTYKIIKE